MVVDCRACTKVAWFMLPVCTVYTSRITTNKTSIKNNDDIALETNEQIRVVSSEDDTLLFIRQVER